MFYKFFAYVEPKISSKGERKKLQILNNFFSLISTLVYIGLISSLFILENSTSLIWTIVIPILPMLFLLIGYTNWRNICPLAFISKFSQSINWIPKRKVPQWFEDNFYFFQFFLLVTAFSSRLIFLNFDNFSLGIFFILISLIAFGINLFFNGKSWCNFFCPVAVVEKVYCISNSHRYHVDSKCSCCTYIF